MLRFLGVTACEKPLVDGLTSLLAPPVLYLGPTIYELWLFLAEKIAPQGTAEPATTVVNSLRSRSERRLLAWMAFAVFVSETAPVRAADLEIDRLLQSPVTKDWVTNGGNLTNQRYSVLS